MEGPRFLDQKYKDLTGSREVERAVVSTHVDAQREDDLKHYPERDFSPHTREERIAAYLDRLDYIIKDERGWRRLKYKLQKEFTIDIEDEDTLTKIAHQLYESEKRQAIEQGRGADVARLEREEDVMERYRDAIIEKQGIQEHTLSTWLDYLHQNDAQYPTWFRYFIIRNLEKMGTLNKEKGEYSKRTGYTIAPFPELNSEALGFVYRMLTTGVGHQEFEDAPEKRNELISLVEKKDFIKLYAFAEIETAGALNKESIQGTWVKYDQGSDHHKLEQALKGKGTGWCTAEGSAYAHLEGGDFYVYFTRGTHGTYSEPRVAIRMENGQVAEVRGVNHRQELEPDLVDIAQAQYHSLPGGERFDKKSEDMKRMTALTLKQEKDEPFTKDDLRFLYEIDSSIEGFGYDRDPRIETLRGERNRKEDIITLCDCAPEHLATDFTDLTPTTEVFCEDADKKITLVDFREEKNKAKFPQLIELAQKLKEVGSPAHPDLSFEGGIVSIEIDQKMEEALTTWDTAQQAYKEADNGSPSYIWDEWKKGEWKPPTGEHLEIVVLSYNADSKTQQSPDKIVADMDRLGLRPLTLEEMTLAGIAEPKFTKTLGKYFVGLTKYARGDRSCVPNLWRVGARRLGNSGWADGWSAGARFLCVRKSR